MCENGFLSCFVQTEADLIFVVRANLNFQLYEQHFSKPFQPTTQLT